MNIRLIVPDSAERTILTIRTIPEWKNPYYWGTFVLVGPS